MTTVRYHPRAPLGAYVECFWWSRREHAESVAEHMLPSGSAQLIFALHDASFTCVAEAGQRLVWSHGIVHGPQGGFYRAAPKPAGTTVGVSFRPGAAGAILGVPTVELSDAHVPLDALWGRRGRELRERLLAAAAPGAIFEILERELLAGLSRRLMVHPAVAPALATHPDGWPTQRVAAMQELAGYSPRHFISLFRNAVGLTPKHFYRVRRFARVAQHLAQSEVASLADLAIAAGYADQAHLSREFREFAGTTPTRFRPRSAEEMLHHRAIEATGA